LDNTSPGQVPIEVVVGQVLRDEHADLIGKSLRAVSFLRVHRPRVRG
jgi:hypothetical protein